MQSPARPWRRTAVVAAVLLLVAGVLVAVAFGGGLLDSDRSLLAGAVGDRTPGLTTAAVVVTTLGSTVAMAVLAVLVGALLLWRGRRDEAVFLVATTGTASVVFTVVKRVLDRARPPTQFQVLPLGNESLPSGHATMSAAVIGAIVVLAWPRLTRSARGWAVLAATLWVVAVGCTRIYLGAHWFSDVLAGWAFGLGWAALGAAILFRWRAGSGTPLPEQPPGDHR